MGLVLIGGLVGFTTAVGGLCLGLSPRAALGIWAGSGSAAAVAAIVVSQAKRPDEVHSEPSGALPVFA